jgi:hypothetical protein
MKSVFRSLAFGLGISLFPAIALNAANAELMHQTTRAQHAEFVPAPPGTPVLPASPAAAAAPAQPPTAPPPLPGVAAQLPAGIIAFDAEMKEASVKGGEIEAHFSFNLTNVSPGEVTINSVSASCGCTAAKVLPLPWVLVPGTHG